MTWEQIKDTIYDVVVNGGLTLLKLLGVFVAGYIIIRIVKKIVRKILEKSRMDKLAKKFIFKTLSVVLYATLILTLVQVAGIPITGLIAGITALGLAVGLALKDSLSSLANGVVLVITKPFKENDVVEINGIEGRVRSIRFFSTTIDTWDNKRIIIPNKNMVNYEIVNINYHDKRRFSIDFKVPFGTDIKKLREIAIKCILSNPNVFTDPAPDFRVKEMTSEGLEVQARGWAVSSECDGTGIALTELILNEMKKNGINIALKKTIIHMDERNEQIFYDDAPIPERDLSKEPEVKKETDLSFDQVLDGFVLKSIKRKKKDKKKADFKDEAKSENIENTTEENKQEENK